MVVKKKKGTNHGQKSGCITPIPMPANENNHLVKSEADCSTNVQGTNPRTTSNDKLKGKLEEQRNIVSRRPLWNNIMEFGLNCSLPWLVMGDFNKFLNLMKNAMERMLLRMR